MIAGSVNAQREAIIRVRARGPAGVEEEFDAVIDTGFDGWLSMPPDLIAVLGLPWLTQGRAMLGDGSEVTVDLYRANVEWDGAPRSIIVDEADTTLLVGMSLLQGYDLHVRIVDGGSVTIEKVP